MGEQYGQLTLEERCSIASLRAAGQSIRQIAAALDRQPSTISRELKRNCGNKVGYQPAYAQQQTHARRWSGSRLERDQTLRDEVLGCLRDGCSPEQVAGRLARETGQSVISYETIYRFIYAQIRRTNDFAWRHYLPRAKFKRGWRARPGGSPTLFIKDRHPISQRPKAAQTRQTIGHWEADYMRFATADQSVLVLHERASRVILLTRTPNRQADTTATAIAGLLGPLAKRRRSTLTIDNGTEFAFHYLLTQQLGIKTYFCDTHSPWQKGGIENAIGRLRRYLPTRTNLNDLPPGQISQIASTYNHTPRKCLDFQTPIEAFSKRPLHFKCESTPRPSPG
jgi:IS30 family transposase